MEKRAVKHCPVCQQNNEITELRLYQISCTKGVYFCQKDGCMYPIGYGWTFVDRSLEKFADELLGPESESEESEDSSSDEEMVAVFATINILDHSLEYCIKLYEESDNGFIKKKKRNKVKKQKKKKHDKKVVSVETTTSDKLDSALDFLDDINFSEENIKPIEQNDLKAEFGFLENKTLDSYIDQCKDNINDEFTTDFLNSLIGHTENNECNENNQLNVSLTDFDMFGISDSVPINTEDAIIASNENNQQNSEDSNLMKESSCKNEFFENSLSNEVFDEELIWTESKVEHNFENKLDKSVNICSVEKDNYDVEEMELIENQSDIICTNEAIMEITSKTTIPALAPYKIGNRSNITQKVKINSDIQILDVVDIPVIFEGSPEAESLLNLKMIDLTNSVNEIVNDNLNSFENKLFHPTTSCNKVENIEISKKIDNVDNIVHCIENNETNKINDSAVANKSCSLSENTRDNHEAFLNASVKTLQLRNTLNTGLETIKYDIKDEPIFDSIESNKDNKTNELQIPKLAPLTNSKHILKCFQLKDFKEEGVLNGQDLKQIDEYTDTAAYYIVSNREEIPRELENAKVIHIAQLCKMPPIVSALDSGEMTKKQNPSSAQCSVKKRIRESKRKVSGVEMKLDSKNAEMKSNSNCLDEEQSKEIDKTNIDNTDSETDEAAPRKRTKKARKNQNCALKKAKAVNTDNFNSDMKRNLDFLKSIAPNKKAKRNI